MALAICSVIYISVNVVCIVLNSYDMDCAPVDPNCDAVVSKETFHLLEFWATAVFNVVDIVALVHSPKRLGAIFWNPAILKMVMFLNIAGSLIGALLITLNMERFEVAAHELEYSNELTMAFCDLVILASLLRGLRRRGKQAERRDATNSLVLVCVATCVALVQLGIYNFSGWEDGEPLGEHAAHYCEFIFEILSSGITFWFTMDNKYHADTAIASLLSEVPRTTDGASELCSNDDGAA